MSKPDDYVLTLKVHDATYTGKGATTLEALTNLNAPSKLIAKGTLRVEHGKLSKEIYLPPVKLKRLFFPIARQVQAKMLAMGLK